MDWKEVSRKMQEKGEKMQESGKNMQKAGGKLTLKLTIPIVLFVLLGWLVGFSTRDINCNII